MTRLAAVAVLIVRYLCGEDAVSIRFRAVVGDRELACGRSYADVGATKSTITAQDFRFYVHNARLVDEAGREVEIDLRQDGKRQLDDVALLDFEDASGACRRRATPWLALHGGSGGGEESSRTPVDAVAVESDGYVLGLEHRPQVCSDGFHQYGRAAGLLGASG